MTQEPLWQPSDISPTEAAEQEADGPKRRGRIPQSAWPRILELYRGGSTLTAIAREFDCTPSAISYIIRKADASAAGSGEAASAPSPASEAASSAPPAPALPLTPAHTQSADGGRSDPPSESRAPEAQRPEAPTRQVGPGTPRPPVSMRTPSEGGYIDRHAPPEHVYGDRGATDRMGQDRGAGEAPVAERSAIDRPAADRPAADRSLERTVDRNAERGSDRYQDRGYDERQPRDRYAGEGRRHDQQQNRGDRYRQQDGQRGPRHQGERQPGQERPERPDRQHPPAERFAGERAQQPQRQQAPVEEIGSGVYPARSNGDVVYPYKQHRNAARQEAQEVPTEPADQRLTTAAGTSADLYKAWKATPGENAMQALSDSLHELRKVIARIEIEMSASRREEPRPIPVPSYRLTQPSPQQPRS